ncbi:MAG: trypsin-like peptidase domain-containing protein [Omnitrophica bacterium]|nr:trypsin-like peptidase domain-containing protein [Candidatus Omnitrophota bacterium]
MIKILLVLILGIIPLIPFCFGDTITLKSGKIIDGKITEKTSEHIKIEVKGVSIKYYHEEIKNTTTSREIIFYQNPSLEFPETSLETKPQNTRKTPDEIFKEFSPMVVRITAKRFSDYKTGVGFIVSKNGLIMANFHLVGGSDKIEVKLKSGKIYAATSISSYDPVRDICVFRIDADNLPIVTLGNSGSLKTRDELRAITISPKGKYSILEGTVLGEKNIYGENFVQNTIPISLNDSGAPIFDEYGNVVGICSFGDKQMNNFRFGVPINEVKNFIPVTAKISLNTFKKQAGKAYVLLADAKNADIEGDTLTASKILEKAIAIEANFTEAHAVLADLYIKMGRFNDAFFELKKAIFLESDYEKLHTKMVFVYLLKDMPNMALLSAKKALEINPEYAAGYNSLGAVYRATDRIDEAIQEFKRALEIAPGYCRNYEALIEALCEKNDCFIAEKYQAEAEKIGCGVSSYILQKVKTCR